MVPYKGFLPIFIGGNPLPCRIGRAAGSHNCLNAKAIGSGRSAADGLIRMEKSGLSSARGNFGENPGTRHTSGARERIASLAETNEELVDSGWYPDKAVLNGQSQCGGKWSETAVHQHFCGRCRALSARPFCREPLWRGLPDDSDQRFLGNSLELRKSRGSGGPVAAAGSSDRRHPGISWAWPVAAARDLPIRAASATPAPAHRRSLFLPMVDPPD